MWRTSENEIGLCGVAAPSGRIVLKFGAPAPDFDVNAATADVASIGGLFMDREHETSHPSESPHDEETPQPCYARTASRRGFVADVARVGGLALLHFTVLGALAGPAQAGCEDDGCECDSDQGILDVCNCPNEQPGGTLKDYCKCGEDPGLADECGCTEDTDGVDYCTCGHETQLADRCDCDEDQNIADKCDCGTESVQTDSCYCIPDQATADKCDCGDEGAVADYCACGEDNQVADKCDCGTESSSVDHCSCGPDQNVADKCDCGNEGAVADYCACSEDTQVADKCTCGLDEDGVTGSADYCGCAQDTQHESDTCAEADPTPGDNKCPENTAADACLCPPEAPPTDTCQCHHDGQTNPPPGEDYGSGADYCDCKTDPGVKDHCACCGDVPDAEGKAADVCDCGMDHGEGGGSWRLNEGGFPTYRDWCDSGAEEEALADICTCASQDVNSAVDPGNYNNQADHCVMGAGSQGVDRCDCGDEGGGDSSGQGGSDYCDHECNTDSGASDICSCTEDDDTLDGASDYCAPIGCLEPAPMQDTCECSTTDPIGSADYCCIAQDNVGDFCCAEDRVGDVPG